MAAGAGPSAHRKSTGGAPGGERGSVAGTMALLFLKILFWVVALLLPIVGAWLLSSLTAYANGPIWLAFVALFALFPLVPGLWEGISAFRRSRQKSPGERVLTLGDRLLLRTLGVNIVFVVVLLLAAPETGVRALLARGDWMLDGSTSPAANKAREVLFAIADKFEWIYKAGRSKGYEGDGEAKRKDGDKGKEAVPVERSLDEDDPDRGKPPTGDEPPKKPDAPAPDAEIAIGSGRVWPTPNELDPITKDLELDSPEAVGAAIQSAEPDPFKRAKAVHDWIAARVAYDGPVLKTNKFPPQDAVTVFRTRLGVCAGYANLFLAISKAAGLEAVVVVGDAKGGNGEVDGRGHAWNAVKLEGAWYLVDTTWDAGNVTDDLVFQRAYKTDYLFTPPEIFRNNHFPKDDKWQLASVQSRGEFMRSPQLSPAFFKRGMKLVTPQRSQTSVGATAEIVVENPNGQFMMVNYTPKAGGKATRCEVTGTSTLTAKCAFEDEGEYRVMLFGASERYTTYWSMGELQFQSDP